MKCSMRWNNEYCCVPQCRSWAKKDTSSELSFHRFPKENKQKVNISSGSESDRELVDRRKAWALKLCMKKPILNYMRVCSLHFTKDDYFNKGQLSKRGRILKSIAVPSQNLPEIPLTKVSSDPSKQSPDNTPWQPKKSPYNCREHFIDGKKSNIAAHKKQKSKVLSQCKRMDGKKSCDFNISSTKRNKSRQRDLKSKTVPSLKLPVLPVARGVLKTSRKSKDADIVTLSAATNVVQFRNNVEEAQGLIKMLMW